VGDERIARFGGLRPGEIIAGKYYVEGVIGSGGMGVVVAARHVDLDRKVAIKFLLPTMTSEHEAVARFAREARAVAKLQSEHVARVLDVGTLDDGGPYMVMEFLEGEDLGARLRRSGPSPIDLAVDFVLQACVAIAEAHGQRIIHRDLKPSNLFCTRRSDGRPIIKVLDFGISKIVDSNRPGDVPSSSVTRTSAAMGSPPYMSPEQFQSAKDVDARTDIWSLGIILFELLTGKLPFRGEGFGELAVKIALAAPESLRAHRPDAPGALEAIVGKCLAKDRSRRYGNVADLALALMPFGPPEARTSVARISGTLQGAGSSATLSAPPSTQGRRETLPTPPSVAPWAATASGTRGKHVIASVVALVGITGAAAAFGLRQHAFHAASPWPDAAAAAPMAEADVAIADASKDAAPEQPLVLVDASPGASKPTSLVDAAGPAHSGSSHQSSHGASSSSIAVAPPNPHCDPPFYFDERGQKIFKPECFR
jgi:serine/threonine-protein kinase